MRVLLVTCGLVLIGLSDGGKKFSTNRYHGMEEFDPVAITRCDIVCAGIMSSLHELCHDRCLHAKNPKPGSCPSSFAELPIFMQVCVNACAHDFECPETEKCCSHSCGVTCQQAEQLQVTNGLPTVPTNVSARELRGPSIVQLHWVTHPTTDLRSVLFLVEAKSHFGKFFNEGSLDSWMPIHQASSSPTIINGVLQPARWYIFRVAAVNTNGTRGFSSASDPFSLSRPPGKPGRPRRLSATNVREVNGTVWTDLRWTRPKSDVPVRRYKVFWSRRLNSQRQPNSTNVVVNRDSVPKNQLHLQLKNLELNEYYYIQVQALASFGREKLKGAKAELFFNTTTLVEQTAIAPNHARKRRP